MHKFFINQLLQDGTKPTSMKNLLEMFTELMDQIYFPGFTEDVLAGDPERFNFEFNQFKEAYA